MLGCGLTLQGNHEPGWWYSLLWTKRGELSPPFTFEDYTFVVLKVYEAISSSAIVVYVLLVTQNLLPVWIYAFIVGRRSFLTKTVKKSHLKV